MKREPRRVGAPPRETAKPHIEYVVPRHQWPAAWDALSVSRSAFATSVDQGSVESENGHASPIAVLVAERGAAILERLGAQLVGSGPERWNARMREFERLQRAEAAERSRHDAGAADELEAAFQREAERVRARQAGGDHAP